MNTKEYFGHYTDPFYPRFWEDRLRELQLRNVSLIERGLDKPRGIFVCDMGELFGDWLPIEWTEAILNEIDNKYDRFYLLTKQPQNLAKFSPFPDNVYIGVTATNQAMYDSAVYWLHQIEAKVKYISIEPILSHIHLPNYRDVDWLIIGAQTKPYRPPKISWVEEIVKAADRAGIPVFLKDNLSGLIPINSALRYGPAGELRLRQDMPTTKAIADGEKGDRFVGKPKQSRVSRFAGNKGSLKC